MMMKNLLLSILRDPVWQFLFGLIGILITVLLFIADRRRKELSILTTWKPGSSVQCSDTETSIPTRKFVVKLANSGRVPILPSDFERPASLYVPNCQILDATITDTRPSNIHPKASIENGEITLWPILLNPGDSVTFEVISTFVRFKQLVYLDSRIAGIKEVRRLELGCVPLPLIFLGWMLIFGPFIVTAWLTGNGQTDLPAGFESYLFYSFFLGVILQSIGLYTSPWIRAILVEELRTRLEKCGTLLLSLLSKAPLERQRTKRQPTQHIDRSTGI
jgi:hypothetical protein